MKANILNDLKYPFILVWGLIQDIVEWLPEEIREIACVIIAILLIAIPIAIIIPIIIKLVDIRRNKHKHPSGK